ncbi:POK8 protein, partial [Sagittarius serpentarius]|nr:POK8 protein [Sagittarius serpentarius]
PLYVIDLKDCFFTVLLHPDDCAHFAFSVPAGNDQQPMQRCQWVVLPQGTVNSPTICQIVVDGAIQPTRTQFLNVKIYHYMDYILVAAKEQKELLQALIH